MATELSLGCKNAVTCEKDADTTRTAWLQTLLKPLLYIGMVASFCRLGDQEGNEALRAPHLPHTDVLEGVAGAVPVLLMHGLGCHVTILIEERLVRARVRQVTLRPLHLRLHLLPHIW